VICPYGPHNLLEWNHCQPTRVKIILAGDPLRETVTADGPISLQDMFEVGYSVIAASSNVGAPTTDPPAHFFRPPQARTAMPVGAAGHCRGENQTGYASGPPQTDRSIFDSRAMKSPRLSVGKLGWPKGVPRIANLDDEPRRPKSSARSRTVMLKGDCREGMAYGHTDLGFRARGQP